MSQTTAYTGARIFDGAQWHDDSALLVEAGIITAIVAIDAVPADTIPIRLAGGILASGFIDLQVNGGGGALLNERPDLDGIRTICDAHLPFGTTALLPTLVTDTPEITARAIAAGQQAAARNLRGFLGLHLEGPHLSVARKGAHDPALIRPMTDVDLANLIAARKTLPNLLTTVAAETVTPAQIAQLTAAGIVVSIGHSNAGFAQANAAAAAGASMATHLFNAMSQIGNREPGVVGAVLATGQLSAGLIADGIHVDPATIGIALRAKLGPGRIFLVTDAMSPTGTDMKDFMLNGRRVHRSEGALRLGDGTLAGADLTMIEAISYMHGTIGLPLNEALRMATLYPAQAMGIAARYGHLGQGAVANIVHLSSALGIEASWISGELAYRA
ncbi:MAG: N-acetylglucosamine-6-phosphate deacetylase [Hyphomicrobiales bacterium]|nr:N-acetylglucosamine-6-phosphate deacetylase [Hyphomicrobiales bacterium]